MTTRSRSFERYRLKKLLEILSNKRGYHTELISIYVPPDKKISDVLNNLKNEAATATNIKSRLTRKNVMNALAVSQQRLRMIENPPENGLVLFVGAIPQTGPGTEKMEVYFFEPPEHLNIYRYLCSSEFWIEPLQAMLTEKEAFGLMAISRNEAAIAVLRGTHLGIVARMTSGVPGKHHAGGQSQRRYERVIEQLTHEFMIRIGEAANESYLALDDLRGIIVGGSGFTKEQFLEGVYLDQRLKSKVIAIIDLGYGGEEGIRELLERGREHLLNVRYIDEKAIMQSFLGLVARSPDLVTYGENEVRNSLVTGVVDQLILSEDLDLHRVDLRCANCDYAESRTLGSQELQQFEAAISGMSCPKCNAVTTWTIEKSMSLIEELGEYAEQTNASVEVLSSETEEGQQLKKAFGGIAATLRFKMGG